MIRKLHRLCNLCERLMVIHVDDDGTIKGDHAYYDIPGGELWECAVCERKTLEELQEFEEDTLWLDKVWDRVVTKLPNQYVAVRIKHIIAHADNMDVLIEELESRGWEPGKCLVRFTGSEDDDEEMDEIDLNISVGKCIVSNELRDAYPGRWIH